MGNFKTSSLDSLLDFASVTDLATSSLMDWQGLSTGNLQKNIGSIRVEIEEGSSQFSRQHTTDFKAVMVIIDKC